MRRRCYIWLWLTQFNGRVLSCFTLSSSTLAFVLVNDLSLVSCCCFLFWKCVRFSFCFSFVCFCLFVAVCFFLLYALVFYVYCRVLPDVLSLRFFHWGFSNKLLDLIRPFSRMYHSQNRKTRSTNFPRQFFIHGMDQETCE